MLLKRLKLQLMLPKRLKLQLMLPKRLIYVTKTFDLCYQNV